MKIISITEFTTTEGSNKVTEIPLDDRPGLLFRVVTDTFKTPPFSLKNVNIPIRMLHDDRAPSNVKLTVTESTAILEQVYQQSERGLLICFANDDWTDSSELRPVIIDAMNIDEITLNNGTKMSVVASVNNTQIRLVIYNTSSGQVYSNNLITVDGKEYICPLSWTAHNSGTTQNPVYDYHYCDVSRALTVYGKD